VHVTPAVYGEKMWLSLTCVSRCTVIEFLVKEVELKCSDCCVCALVPVVSEGG